MKKSEKLLDAIGQIDDRLVERAAKAGAIVGNRKRGKKKRVTMHRLQGVIAACAMLIVCAGIAGLVQRNGILSDKSGAADMAGEAAADSAGKGEAAWPADAGGEGAAVTSGNENMQEPAAEAGGRQEAEAVEELAELADHDLEAAGKEMAVEDVGQKEETASRSADEKRSGESSMVQSESFNGVSIRAEESSAWAVTFLVTNDGERDILLMEGYVLERQTDGEWQTADPKAAADWKNSGIIVKAGGRYGMTVSLEEIYGKLEPGQYRLVKNYMLAAGKEPQGMEEYPLYLEFEVEP